MSDSLDRRRLIFSIVQFLNRELSSENTHHSDDAKESLEVANQCLQTAFCIAPEDKHLQVNKSLEEIFLSATKDEPMQKAKTPTAEEKEKAEVVKAEGNELMKTEEFQKAIEKYTEAIELDGSNQVFYCNRAAAYSKLNNHYSAVEDCKRAIDMDPTYGKAYGRMGLAYSSVNKHKEAVECFQKAVELEPANDSYKTNLKLAEDKLTQTGSPGPVAFPNLAGMAGGMAAGMAGAEGIMPGMGGMDLNGILGNPALMNMAQNMLSDPNMQAMMGQMMGGAGGAPGGAPGEGGPNMDGLLQAGQRLAEQMQQSNPELVDQLRRQMQGPGGEGGEKKDDEPTS